MGRYADASVSYTFYTDVAAAAVQALTGTGQEMSRWRSCVDFVNLNMGVAVGRMYVEQYFSKDARENVSSGSSIISGDRGGDWVVPPGATGQGAQKRLTINIVYLT